MVQRTSRCWRVKPPSASKPDFQDIITYPGSLSTSFGTASKFLYDTGINGHLYGPWPEEFHDSIMTAAAPLRITGQAPILFFSESPLEINQQLAEQYATNSSASSLIQLCKDIRDNPCDSQGIFERILNDAKLTSVDIITNLHEVQLTNEGR